MQPNIQQPDPMKVTTGEVRFSYCHLTKPHKNPRQANAEEKFSVTILIPKSDVATRQRIDAAIQAAIADATAKTWGNVRPPQVPIPIHDGDGVKQDGTPFGPECKGHWVMTVGSKTRPGIVDANLQPIMDESQIYSGMYGRVSMRFFGYFNSGKKGIGAGLNNAQKLRDGEPLASYSTPENDFGGGYAAPQVAQPPQYQQPYQPVQQYQPAQPYQQPAQPQMPAQPYNQYQQPPMQGYPQQPVPPQYQQPPMSPQGVQTGAQQPQVGVNPLTGQPMGGSVMGVNINPATGMPF